MADKVLDNNQVTIVGVVDSEFVYSHEVFGEGFYVVEVIVQRLSNMVDRIPLMISERLIDVTENYIGRTLEAHGQFRSYNKHEEGRNRLVLSVFVRDVEVLDEEPENVKPNSIFLDGYICKQPVYRMTPLGREIADLLLASTGLMENRIIFRVSVGDEMPVLQGNLRLEPISISGDGFKAGLTRNGLKAIRWNVGQPMRFR